MLFKLLTSSVPFSFFIFPSINCSIFAKRELIVVHANLHDVVTSLFQSCDNALTSTAANQCLEQLSAFLGPNIFRGRVEQYNPRWDCCLD